MTSQKYRIPPQRVKIDDGIYFIKEKELRYRGEIYEFTERAWAITNLIWRGRNIVGYEINYQVEISITDFDGIKKDKIV